MKNTTQLGLEAETKAARFLKSNGHRIIGRNFRTRFYELDIISLDGEYIVLTEVKYRTSNSFGLGIESISKGKAQRLKKGFMMWLAQNPNYSRFQPRIDVVGVIGNGALEHIENAIN